MLDPQITAFLLDVLKLGAVLAGFLWASAMVVFTVHEAGHALMARAFGVKISEFSLGVGKPLAQRTLKSGLILSFRRWPVAAFVSMNGGGDGFTFAGLAGWKRIFIILAGPCANLLTTLIFLVVLYLAVGNIGNPPVIMGIEKDSPADQAGLQLHDRVLAIDGKPIETARAVKMGVRDKWEGPVKLLVERNGQQFETTVTPRETRVDVLSRLFRPLGEIGVLLGEGNRVSLLRLNAVNGVQVAAATGKDERKVLAADELGKVLRGEPTEITLTVRDPQTRTERTFTSFAYPRFNKCLLHEHGQGVETPWRCGLQLGDPFPPIDPFPTTGAALTRMMTDIAEFWEWLRWDMVLDPTRFDSETLSRSLKYKSLPFGFLDIVSRPAYAIATLITMIAALSFTLGLINLLPFPMLDGNHIFFMVMRRLYRRDLTPKEQGYTQIALFGVEFLALLALLIIKATHTFW